MPTAAEKIMVTTISKCLPSRFRILAIGIVFLFGNTAALGNCFEMPNIILKNVKAQIPSDISSVGLDITEILATELASSNFSNIDDLLMATFTQVGFLDVSDAETSIADRSYLRQNGAETVKIFSNQFDCSMFYRLEIRVLLFETNSETPKSTRFRALAFNHSI